MKKYILELTAFICGAAVMILEFVGSRVIAPHLGTSTFVWTSIIGVILASLSFGYWWGGKIADKGADHTTLAKTILLGAIFICSSVFLQPFLETITSITDSIRTGAVLASIVFFMPATIAFGTVSPLIVKLTIKNIETSGRTVGRLYALSTIGSIVGTFLGGFYLISFIGTTNILLGLGIITASNSLLLYVVYKNQVPKIQLILISLLIVAPIFNFNTSAYTNTDRKIIADKDTNYSRLIIFDSKEKRTGRPIRVITNNINIGQSGMYLDNPSELLFAYTKMFDLVEHFNGNIKKTLLIGAGGYSYPKYFQKKYPNRILDVVEIDPGFTALSKQYFNFEESENIRVIHKDGRIFLNETNNVYDAIIIDAFPSNFAIPFHLTTVEAVRNVHRILSADGVVIINIISSLTGKKSKFLQAEYATYKSLFPHVFLFQAGPAYPEETQNILFVALKSPLEPSWESRNSILNSYLGRLWKESYHPTLPALTDNLAPVERYVEDLY